MTRAIPTTDSSDAVDTSYLVATFEPGDNPMNPDPVPQSIADVVGSVYTAASESKLAGIEAGAQVNPPPPSVVIASSSTAIPASARGDTYVHTGSSDITYTLPPASGGGAVADGWDVTVSNQGAGDLTIDGHGADTIDRRATLVLQELGRTVHLLKAANGAWISTADTKDETGASSGVDQTARDAAAVAARRTVASFGILTAAANSPVPGYTFTGYAGPRSTTGLVGAVAGDQSVPIRGLYTATVRTTAALPDIVEGATYYARLGTTDAPEGPVPLYVIVDDVAYGVGAAVNGLFYAVEDFGGFISGTRYRVQVIYTDGTLWIAPDETEDRPAVVNVSVDTAIPATAFSNTYRVIGNVARTITLPDPAAVPVGWFVRVANGSRAGTDHSVAREGAGQSIEGGNGPLAVRSGESITLQLVNTAEWELIADTAQGAAVTGGALSLSTALTDAQKKAWRAHFGSWHLDVTDDSTLPAIANYNGPDGILLGQSGDTTVAFADISDRSQMLTAGVAGDLMLLLGRGWVRVGNLFTGGAAVAAVRAIAETANSLVRRISLLTLYVDPGVVEQQAPATRVNAITGNYRLVLSPPDMLAGEDVWVRVFGRGQPLNARMKLDTTPAPQVAIPFTINAVTAQNIVNNDPVGDSVDIEVFFYTSNSDDGLIEIRPVSLDVVQTPRVDDRQPLLTALGNGQVWRSAGAGPVPFTLPVRFERAVGASPAVLPAGTFELALKVSDSTHSRVSGARVLLSDIPAANEEFSVRLIGPDNVIVTWRYTAATRTLTYAVSGTDTLAMRAIGEA